MAAIQIEADVSAEQLLRAVEQLPPQELAAFLAHLLARLRNGTLAVSASAVDREGSTAIERRIEANPYLTAAGTLAGDTFAAEVEAFINARREREREEAARAADA